MYTTQLTVEQRIDKAMVDIMANPKYVALAGILMIGSKRVEDDPAKCPTAYTNGRDVVFGRKFVEGLTDAELRFLILHEEYHKLYRHLTTWKWMFDEYARGANAACDFVINLKITDDNPCGWAEMPACGLPDPKYRGWDSAEVYADLKKNAKPGSGNDGFPAPGEPGGGFDEHKWDDAAEMDPQEQKELAREIDQALRQGALAAGKMGSGGDRSFDELMEPQVDWRDALREFVQTTCAGSDYSTWQRPNRRYVGAGYYMPSGISERIGEIVIAPDMSGSTFTPSMMTAIMSEVKGIAETVKADAVRLLYWDTEVCGDERYEAHELDGLMSSTKPAGGGGTTVECVPDHMRKHNITPQCVVVLTDGYLGGSWGQWDCPVLWVVVDNRNAAPTTGTVLHVKSRDL